MSDLTPATVLAVFLIFCRIGSCVMIMPGMSIARVPMQMRLFEAAGEPKRLLLADRFGHAEDGLTSSLARTIARAVHEAWGLPWFGDRGERW